MPDLASLLVWDVAPPRPLIWRMSGLPNNVQEDPGRRSMKLFPVDGGLGEDLFTPMMTALVAVDQLKQGDIVP